MIDAPEQLELDVEEDDGLSWDEWFCSLPATPGPEAEDRDQ